MATRSHQGKALIPVLVFVAVILVAAIAMLVLRTSPPQNGLKRGQVAAGAEEQREAKSSGGRDLSRHKASADAASKNWSAILFDPAQPMKLRREAANELAKLGTDEAMRELKSALKDGEPKLRAFVADALGISPHPEARLLLKELVNDKDELVAAGAVNGWARVGDREAIEVLTGILQDEKRNTDMRGNAAMALGSIKDPSALKVLISAATGMQDTEVIGQIMQGIGQRPFSETQSFYQQYLAQNSIPQAARVAAVESIGNADGQTTAFLMQYARDADAQVRAGAAWAISNNAERGQSGPEIMGLLQQESDNSVRMRLYQALGNQEQVDATAVMGMVQREVNSDTRLAGLELLSERLNPQEQPEVSQYFNQSAVPELKTSALSGATDYERMVAALALLKARTPESMQALEQIATQTKDPRVARIAKGSAIQSRKRSSP
jgi:HEAT repeat protein